MHYVGFIVALVVILTAACLFGRGIVKLYRNSEKSRGLISSGFVVGLCGVIIATILFGFFSL